MPLQRWGPKSDHVEVAPEDLRQEGMGVYMHVGIYTGIPLSLAQQRGPARGAIALQGDQECRIE